MVGLYGVCLQGCDSSGSEMIIYFSTSIQTSILCEKPGLSISSDSMAVLKNLNENKTAAILIHNPLPVQRSTYITVQLPEGLCTQVNTCTRVEAGVCGGRRGPGKTPDPESRFCSHPCVAAVSNRSTASPLYGLRNHMWAGCIKPLLYLPSTLHVISTRLA